MVMVKRMVIAGILCCLFLFAFEQKIDSIYFHLYTDSLKKGGYNYINVDGLCADGHWLPLTEREITFTANTGYFKGNDLFIDSLYTGEMVTVKAVLKSNPAIWKEQAIYIRKRPFTEPLPTIDDIFQRKNKGRSQRPMRHDF